MPSRASCSLHAAGDVDRHQILPFGLRRDRHDAGPPFSWGVCQTIASGDKKFTHGNVAKMMEREALYIHCETPFQIISTFLLSRNRRLQALPKRVHPSTMCRGHSHRNAKTGFALQPSQFLLVLGRPKGSQGIMLWRHTAPSTSERSTWLHATVTIRPVRRFKVTLVAGCETWSLQRN